ncbi:MAG: protein-L-isoaspartate(D-aspartate) O-methyltransferase [Xanthomonadales bacterium]|nr:protein-L-isoaspartate(D-aspartate) O-methyltransferase [Xanthomonadales bacterium]
MTSLLLLGPAQADGDSMGEQREALVEVVAQQLKTWKDGPPEPVVLKALRTVPRHEFVPRAQRRFAYQNRPLPIGYGQTISQPFIVALMTDLIKPGPGQKILEIGTGSGYQAAILSAAGAEVFSIEIVPELGEAVEDRFERLGYAIETRIGDGYYGWEAHAPFDAIIVTAAAGHVPPPLVDQLKVGGRMVIPVGPPFLTQQLMVIDKTEADRIRSRQLLPVRFVPLTGGPD